LRWIGDARRGGAREGGEREGPDEAPHGTGRSVRVARAPLTETGPPASITA
jgi:hypothetical protein